MNGLPVDPESAGSGYAGATRADPSPGAGERWLWKALKSVDEVTAVEELFDFAAQLHLDA